MDLDRLNMNRSDNSSSEAHAVRHVLFLFYMSFCGLGIKIALVKGFSKI
jgi:hypothetical protein